MASRTTRRLIITSIKPETFPLLGEARGGFFPVAKLIEPLPACGHRFIPMDAADFYYPERRSPAYTVIEIAMMSGRSVEAKKRLIHLLFERIESELAIAPIDVEIMITESPASNWGFRGLTGDEAQLNYNINV